MERDGARRKVVRYARALRRRSTYTLLYIRKSSSRSTHLISQVRTGQSILIVAPLESDLRSFGPTGPDPWRMKGTKKTLVQRATQALSPHGPRSDPRGVRYLIQGGGVSGAVDMKAPREMCGTIVQHSTPVRCGCKTFNDQ